MLPKLIITSDVNFGKKIVDKLLIDLKVTSNNPDLLWIDSGEKSIGVEEAKKIRRHFHLKPYSTLGKVAVILGADKLTAEAQNSLLKTLEEPPSEANLILTTSQEEKILPTIISRCEIVRIDEQNKNQRRESFKVVIEQLLVSNIEKRFEIIEKVEEKEAFLKALEVYFYEKLRKDLQSIASVKLILEAKKWQGSNVNIRAILEYLSLNLPKLSEKD